MVLSRAVGEKFLQIASSVLSVCRKKISVVECLIANFSLRYQYFSGSEKSFYRVRSSQEQSYPLEASSGPPKPYNSSRSEGTTVHPLLLIMFRYSHTTSPRTKEQTIAKFRPVVLKVRW